MKITVGERDILFDFAYDLVHAEGIDLLHLSQKMAGTTL